MRLCHDDDEYDNDDNDGDNDDGDADDVKRQFLFLRFPHLSSHKIARKGEGDGEIDIYRLLGEAPARRRRNEKKHTSTRSMIVVALTRTRCLAEYVCVRIDA